MGAGQYESIFCGQGELFRVPELKARTDEYLECVRQAGREYAQKQAISEDAKEKLRELLYPRDVFEKMADASWGVEKKSGEKEDPVLTFTRQMAALYNKDSFDQKSVEKDKDGADAGVQGGNDSDRNALGRLAVDCKGETVGCSTGKRNVSRSEIFL